MQIKSPRMWFQIHVICLRMLTNLRGKLYFMFLLGSILFQLCSEQNWQINDMIYDLYLDINHNIYLNTCYYVGTCY